MDSYSTSRHARKPLTDTTPNSPPSPRNRDLLVPWLIVAVLFTLSLIIAIVTMIRGMTYGINHAALPSWYHPLLLLSQSGLTLSTAGILILVAVSFRRALKHK